MSYRCGRRFCNMEEFERCVRHDSHCRCQHKREYCDHEHRHKHEGCKFEARCNCLGNSICVKICPEKCALNLEVKRIAPDSRKV